MRKPDTDLEKIAVMSAAGLPADLAIELFTDFAALENDIRIRGLLQEYPTDRPLERLGIIVLAYFRPERLLGVDVVDELEVPNLEAT